MTQKPARPLLKKQLKVISLGLPLFADAMRAQGAQVEQVEWRPPARGDKKLLEILRRLR